jgi:hypothetical protein
MFGGYIIRYFYDFVYDFFKHVNLYLFFNMQGTGA